MGAKELEKDAVDITLFDEDLFGRGLHSSTSQLNISIFCGNVEWFSSL
jgi:hypothetical protein